MWKVDLYVNAMREVKEPRDDLSCDGAWYFHTREQAVAFILSRAERQVEDAEVELQSRRRALNGLKKKYATVAGRCAVTETLAERVIE